MIAPGIDWPVGIAARVAEKMGLPASDQRSRRGPRRLEAEAARAPRGGRRARSRAGTSCPSPRQGLPVPILVVKAPDRQGQKGLTLVRSEEELPAAIAGAIEESRSGVALVEEVVDGPEVTVNAFSLRGEFNPLTVTDRLTAEPPAFGVALAHVWPSEAGRSGGRGRRGRGPALGIENGPTYTQLRIGPDGPQVIEVAARLGGGHDAELAKLALGVDLNGLALQAALGESIWSAALHPARRSAARSPASWSRPRACSQEVEGIEEARAVEGVAGRADLP